MKEVIIGAHQYQRTPKITPTHEYVLGFNEIMYIHIYVHTYICTYMYITYLIVRFNLTFSFHELEFSHLVSNNLKLYLTFIACKISK